jgi:hypothetical protein
MLSGGETGLEERNEKDTGSGEGKRKSPYHDGGHNLHVECQVKSHLSAQGRERSNVQKYESLGSKNASYVYGFRMDGRTDVSNVLVMGADGFEVESHSGLCLIHASPTSLHRRETRLRIFESNCVSGRRGKQGN